MKETLLSMAQEYLRFLCEGVGNRSVGSEGNRKATAFFKREIESLGWQTESQEFAAMDWEGQGASLEVDGDNFEVLPGPYSLGCEAEAELAGASTIEELERLEAQGKIILLHRDIAREQLMPKNFVFWNPEEHRRIVAALEGSGAAALVCATGRNPSLSGGVYPFPLIEDGDFDVPSVCITDVEGKRILPLLGKIAKLRSFSTRIPGTGENIVARNNTFAKVS